MARGEKVRNGERWTEARFWSFIRSLLRSGFRKWGVKVDAQQRARRLKKGYKRRYEYRCNKCKGWFPNSQVEVDHITPAGSLKCYDDLAGFVHRLFPEIDGLQVLCKPCHKVKTAEERAAAVAKRKKK